MTDRFSSSAQRPKYRHIAERVRHSLQERKPGDRISTEAEYAHKFAASVWTVRQALELLDREGLIEKRQGSGTFVCPPLPPRQHVAVLLDVDIAPGRVSPYYTTLPRAIRTALQNLGIASRPYLGTLPLGTEATGLTCQDLLDDVRLGRVRGLISFFTKRSPEWTELFKRKGIPVMDPEYYLLDRHNSAGDEEFLHAAFRYFVECGKRHVALLIWESATDRCNFFSKSFRSLAQEYGVRVDEHLVDITASGWERGMGWERFRDIWRSKTGRPDGLIIGDDGLFKDCQKAILELGISVPRELSVAIRASDAVELAPEFPIYIWQLCVKEQATIYAREMKDLLEGKTPSVVNSWPHTAQIVYPTTIESDGFSDEIRLMEVLAT